MTGTGISGKLWIFSKIDEENRRVRCISLILKNSIGESAPSKSSQKQMLLQHFYFVANLSIWLIKKRWVKARLVGQHSPSLEHVHVDHQRTQIHLLETAPRVSTENKLHSTQTSLSCIKMMELWIGSAESFVICILFCTNMKSFGIHSFKCLMTKKKSLHAMQITYQLIISFNEIILIILSGLFNIYCHISYLSKDVFASHPVRVYC